MTATIHIDTIVDNLLSKGFSKSDASDNGQLYLDFFHKGNFVLYVKVNQVETLPLPDFYLETMARQCRINKEQFLELSQGDMTKNDYLDILKAIGEID